MKITIYTVETCKFSAEEKEYLKSKNLPFEEKNVETDHAALEMMLKIGNNFAGTPVTEIAKDDGTTVVLKGFTKEEFENELFPKPKEETKPADAPAGVEPGAVSAPQAPAMPAPPAMSAAPAMPAPPAPPASPSGNPLDSILQDLQSKIPPPTIDQGIPQQPAPPAPAPQQAPPTPPQMPPAPPTPVDPQQPTVPDFPKQ